MIVVVVVAVVVMPVDCEAMPEKVMHVAPWRREYASAKLSLYNDDDGNNSSISVATRGVRFTI